MSEENKTTNRVNVFVEVGGWNETINNTDGAANFFTDYKQKVSSLVFAQTYNGSKKEAK
jgi:hypothetical protein